MLKSREIKDLHPTLQRAATEFLKRCTSAGLKVLITQTLRDNEYQDSLYAQGRTKPGSIVTNCKGGHGPHNFGIAFDICQNVKGKEYSDSSFFKKCGKIWQDMGGTWGGAWKSFVDMPHMEFTNGQSYSYFIKGNKMADVKMKWELVVTPAKPTVPEAAKVTRPTLKLGSKGDDVKILQKALNAKGFNCGIADGSFGNKTDIAVKAFQTKFGLKADGVVGPNTWAKLI